MLEMHVQVCLVKATLIIPQIRNDLKVQEELNG